MKNSANTVLEGILDSSNRETYALDLNFRYLAFNNRHEAQIKKRLNREIRPGDEALDCMEKSNRQVLEERFKKAFRGESFVEVDEVKHQPNDIKNLEYYFFPLRNAENEIYGAALMVTDVSEVMSLRRQMRLQESRSQMLVNMMPDLVMLLNNEGKILFANEACERYYGKSQEKLRGKEFSTCLPSSRRAPFRKQLKNMSPGHPVFSGTALATQGGGQKRWIHWIISGVFGDEGQPEEILVVGRNIDRLKRAELYRDRQFHSLEDRISATSRRFTKPVENLRGISNLISDNMQAAPQLESIMNNLNQSTEQLDKATRELVEFIQHAKVERQ